MHPKHETILLKMLILPSLSATVMVTGKNSLMTLTLRGLASFAGALTVGLAILTSSGISGVLQLGNTAMSVLAGPLLALFVLGFFTHTANRIVSMFVLNLKLTGSVFHDLIRVWLLRTGAEAGDSAWFTKLVKRRVKYLTLAVSQRHVFVKLGFSTFESDSILIYLQGDQTITIFFSKNSPKSHQVKKGQNICNKAQFQSPKHLHETTFETLKYPQQTMF